MNVDNKEATLEKVAPKKKLQFRFKCFAVRFLRVPRLLSSIIYDIDRERIALISCGPILAGIYFE